MEDILAAILIFGGGTVAVLAFSPLGRALANRIQGGARPDDEQLRRVAESNEATLEELEQVRRDLTELQERMDFAERLLARQRETGKLPDGSDRPE